MQSQRKSDHGIHQRLGRLKGRYERLPETKMSSWYSIFDLFHTVLDISISGMFNSRVDHRTLQAVESQGEESLPDPALATPSVTRAEGGEPADSFVARPKFFDYSQSADPEFWFDFAADVGDGFNSTYYVAALLSQPKVYPLPADPQPFPLDKTDAMAQTESKAHAERLKAGLPRGRFLLLGGDEVYPSASRKNYEQRFVRVYEAAAYSETPPDKISATHLYAVPGNHDWYDGLASFMSVFAEQRAIGDFRTQQRTSYFAIKLPHGVWIFAIDIGLAGELDRRQVEHFQDLAKKHLVDGDRIILCIAEPDWVKARPNIENLRDGLFYFERKLAEALTGDSACEPDSVSPDATSQETNVPPKRKDVRVILRLAGDLHHYRRHTSNEPLHPTDQEAQKGSYVPSQFRPIENITAGGGGAFLHPTHEIDEDRRGAGKRTEGSIKQYPPGLYRGDATPSGEHSEDQQGIAFEFRKAFPSLAESRKITLMNLAFGHYNLRMTLTLWMIYTLLQNAGLYLFAISHYAWLVLLMGCVLAAFVLGTRSYARSEASGEIGESKQGRTREVYRRASRIDKAGYSGIVHGVSHVLSFFGVFAGLVVIYRNMLDAIVEKTCPFFPESTLLKWVDAPDFASMSRFVLSMAAGGICAIVSTVIFGLYLYFALNHSKLKLHANGAFASLRIADFKNFLRICVTADGIQVFPIGIRKVPEDWDLEIPSMQEAGKGEKDEGQQRSLFYPKPGKFASRTTPSSWYERLTKSTPLSEPFLIEGPVCIKKNT